MITVVTGFSEAGYRLYGKNMVESFLKYWKGANLIVYTTVEMPPGVERRNMPGRCAEFLARHGSDPYAGGKMQKPGFSWKAKDERSGYSFLFDALKFCQMAMFTQDAAKRIKEGILVWFDGDTVTQKPVPQSLVEEMMEGADLIYLGREPYHSETGFVAFRLPQARAVAEGWGAMYDTDQVFNLPEWHSAFVFDHVRKLHSEVRAKDLTPGGRKHVFFQSEIGDYVTHLKGEKPKMLGYVPQDKRPK